MRWSILLLAALSELACNAQTCTDVDGNTYQTQWIGFQLWTAENLRTTSYRNGDAITTGLSNSDWAATTAGAHGYYEDNLTYQSFCGNLYNWYAVTDPRGLCPLGWRVPTDADFITLEIYLGISWADATQAIYRGDEVNAGGHLKSLELWNAPNLGADNTTGFTALPCGDREGEPGITEGYYKHLGDYGTFWTSYAINQDVNVYHRRLFYAQEGIGRGYGYTRAGFSCRCVWGEDVGVSEQSFEGSHVIHTGPNPTTGVCTAYLSNSTGYYVFDGRGALVRNGYFRKGSNTYSLAGLAPGLYTLRLAEQLTGGIRIVLE